MNLFSHALEKFPELIYSHSSVEKGHGRLETRTISVLATHNSELEFPGVQQIALLSRQREILKSGAQSSEQVFLITNLTHEQANAETIANLKRSYWHIENKLHYRKDFVFGEDRSTIRKGNGPQNISSLRNFALGVLLALDISNVKRCVDNLQHDPYSLLRMAA